MLLLPIPPKNWPVRRWCPAQAQPMWELHAWW
jgi:hypothetical protein